MDLELERALKELARKRVKHTRAAIINKREKLKATGVPISIFLNQQHLAKEKMVHLRPEPTAAYELYRPEGTHGLDLFGFLRQYEGESYARKLQLNIKDSVDGMVSKIEETLLAKSDELGDLWVKKEYMSPFNVNVYLVSRTEDIDRVVFYIRVEESSSKRHDSSKVSLGTFDFDMYGAPALCIALSDMLQKNVQKASRLKWFYTSGSQQVHDRTFFISDLKPTYDEFYPCIKQGVAKYFDDFFNSTSNIMILLGPPGTGKAQPLDAKIRIPGGWKNMGDIRVNDDIVAWDGTRSKVIGVFPQGKKKIYKITFKDGRSTRACEDHLWKVNLGDSTLRRDVIVQTKDFLTMRNSRGRNLTIPMVNPELIDAADLPIDPYMLGILIGDGNLNEGKTGFTSTDPEIVERIRSLLLPGYQLVQYDISYYISQIEWTRSTPNYYRDQLDKLGLNKKSYEKHIPAVYMNASFEQKLELIRGLLDSDGYANRGTVSLSTTSEQLADDFIELVRSIGAQATKKMKRAGYKNKHGESVQCRDCYTVYVRYENPSDLVWLTRKKETLPAKSQYSKDLRLLKIEEDGVEECQCIAIDHKDQLYITDDYIVTHNTSLIRSMLYTRNMTGWFTYDEHVLNSDMFYVDYMTSNAEILVVEDADVLLTDRESKGNKSMAKMLNVSDGLVKVMSKKIIFTANLTNKNKIDQALLRPGRCFDAIVLDELNREQAAAVANKLGVEVPNKKFVTLAEIFNNRKTDGSINNADVDMSVGFGLGGYRSFDDD